MTSSSPMHNERSGGNISLLQIAARAADCLNNRKGVGGGRGLAFLAGFKDGAEPGHHSFPRPWARHMETSQSRREDRVGEEGVISSAASGWTPSLHPKEEGKKNQETTFPHNHPNFFLWLAFSFYAFFICRTIPVFTGFSNLKQA